MEYQSNSMRLKVLSVILKAEANDVLLCRRILDVGQEAGGDSGQDAMGCSNKRLFPLYLLWVLRDRKIIRYLIPAETELSWIECFPYGELLCITMPYQERRPLLKFWKTEIKGKEQKEELCRELIGLCMTVRLPAPILYLLLDQRLISIRKGGALYFTYELDFSELDGQKTEKDCMGACVRLLQELSVSGDKDGQRMLELMEKKRARNHYHCFLDLYLDWKRPPARQREWSVPDRIKVRTFYFLTVLAVLLLILLAIIIISQLAFGEVPLFRMFMETFREIGTEMLGR